MKKKAKVYGYIRVSSRDQNEDRQLIAMKDAGVPEGNIFIDKQSGKDFNRPHYKCMLQRIKKDDLIVIKSIDRLGRNYEDIQEQWKLITKEKNMFIALDISRPSVLKRIVACFLVSASMRI